MTRRELTMYVLKAEGEPDRELSRDEYLFLIEKLVVYRLARYFKELNK